MSPGEIEEPRLRDIHTRAISGMGRRRFIKTLVGAGISLEAARELSIDDVRAAASDETPIIAGYESEDLENPHETFNPYVEYVPTDWYDDYLRAERASTLLNETYGGQPGIISIGAIPGEKGGANSSVEILVQDTYTNQLTGELPERVSDTPVTVMESPIPEEGCYKYDDGKYVRGGMVCAGNKSYGTLASKMFDRRGRARFATAKHLYRGKGSRVIGKPLWHPNRRKAKIGRVVFTRCKDDFVLAAPRNGHVPVRRIVGIPRRVSGQFSRDGLATQKRRRHRLRKRGTRTCDTNGRIKGVNATVYILRPGCVPRYGQVTWGSGGEDFNHGDSGSVAWRRSPHTRRRIWIASFNQWWQEPLVAQGRVGGTSAWRIRRKYGFHF